MRTLCGTILGAMVIASAQANMDVALGIGNSRHDGIMRSEGEVFAQASWIGVKGRFFHYNTRKEMRTAAVFAKDFTLEAKPEAAALKISVAGYWDIRVNGQEITEDILMPTPSNFDRRVYMKEYDIAPYLTAGVNRIEVTLGNSIYNCPTEGAWMQDTITWRDDPQLICEIVADGRIVAPSDATWRVHLDGPVRRNSIRCGDMYDARKEILSPDGWEDAVKKHGPGGIIVPERHPPTRIWKRIPAKKIGDTLWDSGQNMAGFAEIKVRGGRGAMVTIRTREELGNDGTLADGSSFVSDGEFQCDRYILKGGGEETWHPRFSYGGFRYIETTVSDGEADVVAVTACAVGSDLKEKPFPVPENPALASLLERARWSIRSNMVGFPTDCPSREKQGWTGDALAAAEGAIALYDGAADVYADWLRGLADVQRPNGQIPCKSPISANGYNWGYGPTWDAAIILIPEIIFDATGDDSLAREMYPAARKYAAFMDGMLTDNIAIRFGLGDWTAPARSIPTELLTTAYAREVHRALGRFAERFGFADEAAHHKNRAAAILAAIQRRFCRADGTFTRNEPASLAVVAALKLVPGPEKAAAKLDEIIRRQKGVMNCGMFGSKYIPRALAEYGYRDTAVLCFAQEAAPGWQWQKNEKGATTLWEYWNGSASHNHVIHGGDFPAWWAKYSKKAGK